MFQGEPGKVGRSAIGARECRYGNDCEDDNREYACLGASAELRCIARLARRCDVGLVLADTLGIQPPFPPRSNCRRQRKASNRNGGR